MNLKFPDSPYELHQPFPPAGDQPEAIDKLVEGLSDGLAFQTLLGVTGSGKTFTMANVSRAPAARRWCWRRTRRSRRSSIPSSANSCRTTRSSTSSRITTTTSRRYVPSRDLCIEKDSSINEHIEQMRLSATKSILQRPDCIVVATVSAIYGIGDPSEYHSMILHLRQGDQLTQRDAIKAPYRNAIPAQRHRVPARRSGPRRCARHLPRGKRRQSDSPVRFRRRGGVAAAVRSAHRSHPPEARTFHRVSVKPLRDRTAQGARGGREDQDRAGAAEGGVRARDEADRGAAHRTAHALRRRDDARDRLLQGHRELFAPSVGARARRAAADLDRLPAAQCTGVRR